VITEHIIPVKAGDTLQLAMRADTQYEADVYRNYGPEIKYNENNEKIIYSNDIRLIVRSSKDSIGRMLIEKKAEGSSALDAKNYAKAINYNFTAEEGKLLLDGYLTADAKDKFRDQEVEIILYLPEGAILNADENTYSFHRNNSYYNDILENGKEGYNLLVEDDRLKCLDCPIEEEELDSSDDDGLNIDTEGKVNIDTENFKMNIGDNKVEIDVDGDGESDIKVNGNNNN